MKRCSAHRLTRQAHRHDDVLAEYALTTLLTEAEPTATADSALEVKQRAIATARLLLARHQSEEVRASKLIL